LERQGYPDAAGNKWSSQTVKTVFRNPRLAGYRSRVIRQFDPETCKQSWRIEMVRRPDGTPVRGLFEAVLTDDEWNDVISVIGDNVISGRGKDTRTYLMTGTLRCGREGCGAKTPLVARGVRLRIAIGLTEPLLGEPPAGRMTSSWPAPRSPTRWLAAEKSAFQPIPDRRVSRPGAHLN
jgi:hypothetical protein